MVLDTGLDTSINIIIDLILIRAAISLRISYKVWAPGTAATWSLCQATRNMFATHNMAHGFPSLIKY